MRPSDIIDEITYKEVDLYPSNVIYSIEQFQTFLLPFLHLLEEGEWPCPMPDYEHHEHNRYLAPFVQATEVAAEVNARLKTVPDKLKILLQDLYVYKKDINDFARIHGFDIVWLKSEHRLVMRYISGTKRKLWPYRKWKSDIKTDTFVRYSETVSSV